VFSKTSHSYEPPTALVTFDRNVVQHDSEFRQTYIAGAKAQGKYDHHKDCHGTDFGQLSLLG